MIVSYVPVIFALVAVLVAVTGVGFLIWGAFAEDRLILWLGVAMTVVGLVISLAIKIFMES